MNRTTVRLLFKGVAPWKPLPYAAVEGGCERCPHVPYATRADAYRIARAFHPWWDIRVWRCGEYWHVCSRHVAKRLRAFLDADEGSARG